jgi:hypothetical protein
MEYKKATRGMTKSPPALAGTALPVAEALPV